MQTHVLKLNATMLSLSPASGIGLCGVWFVSLVGLKVKLKIQWKN